MLWSHKAPKFAYKKRRGGNGTRASRATGTKNSLQ